jgi:alpha-glucosidase
MASLASPPVFSVSKEEHGRITLSSSDGAVVEIFVLEDDVVRVAVLPSGKWNLAKTWAIAPGLEDIPTEGRDRLDLSGFSCPEFRTEKDGAQLRVETAAIRLTVKLAGFFCSWEIRRGAEWIKVAKDRPTQAYNFGWWDERVHHYLARDPKEMYFGLGERSGEMNRAGRRFEMRNLDVMGYSARNSDPLYKHIPFYITWKPDSEVAFGLFYDTLSDCVFDMGCERDNYHGLYRSFSADSGDLDYWFIAGPDIACVTRRYTWLTGTPAFLPRWSLGYSGSTMSYTDAPDAQARMADFLAQCEKHDILCESFHLSSGYTSIGKKRYVFHWNNEKFPDPKAFAKSYADKGVHLCPNVKPCLLRDHPLFEEARDKGLLIADEKGEPAWVQFWDEIGAYIDFTNPDAIAWWRDKVTSALLDNGLDSTWNDNNEYEIVSLGARANFFGAARPAREVKPLQPLLMTRASREAQKAHAPAWRPYVVTRSGMAGLQRYAQTWSGDNTTSWETLKYNLKMGQGLALCGISNIGHDVGGFAGPKPDEELFVRWVQSGVFHPRFSIHSWNDDGSANEPWMHPNATPVVRDLIKFRGRLAPYLYDLMWRYHRGGDPMLRPTFHNFPRDHRTFEENDEMMLGASLLVAPVVEPGQMERLVYLPRSADWVNWWTDDIGKGGDTVACEAPWNRPVLFARVGSIIPLNIAEQRFAKPAYTLALRLFPPAAGVIAADIFEDDGETEAYRGGAYRLWRVGGTCDASSIRLSLAREGAFAPSGKTLRLLLPLNDTRRVEVTGHATTEETFESRRCVLVGLD